MNLNLEPDNLATNTYIAAVAGAILGLRAFPGSSLLERFTNLFSGFLFAVFIGPAIVDYLHISSLRLAAGLVFAVGASGLVIFAAMLEGVKQTQFGVILAGWITRRGN